jgi:secreted trypsin-like serine protease
LINFTGDSGGAFIVKSGGKWYLRGIVSSALYNQEIFMCDVNNYAVFTDAAKYKSWILNKIETYG